MPALDFPLNPSPGDVYAGGNGVNYIYDTSTSVPGVWRATPAAPLTITSPGSIAGTPTLGSTLTYTPGTATGGSGTVVTSWIWKRSSGATLQTGGSTFILDPTLTPTLVGDSIYVEFTATDAVPNTVTANTSNFPTAPATISKGPFPSAVWNPLPANGLDLIPGGQSGTYNGTGTTITTTGCIEVSINGGAYGTGGPISSGQTLATRWSSSAGCGGAATGTPLTGTVSDGTYEKNYNISVDRVPSPAVIIPDSTNVTLGGTVSNTSTAVLAGLNTTAYVTLGSGSTGTNIRVSTDGTTWTTLSGVPGASMPITNGQTLHVEQTVGTTVNTTTGYTAVLAIGDQAGISGAAGTYSTVTYKATTVASAVFPNLAAALAAGPTEIPEIVSATWADGAEPNLTSTGCIQISLNGTSWGQGPLSVTNTSTLYMQWDPVGAGCGGAADGTIINGTITNGTYTNSYSLQLDRNPTCTPAAVPSITGQALSSTATSNPAVVLSASNAPAYLTYTAPTGVGANPLTNLSVSINGGGYVAVPASGNTLEVPPGASLLFQGDVAGANNTAYTTTFNLGTTTLPWSVTTTLVTPTVTTPSITSPNGSPPTLLNPALNSPAGITLMGDAYADGPTAGDSGGHGSSDWQVYKANLTPPETSGIQVVTPSTAPTYSSTLTESSTNGWIFPPALAFDGNTGTAAEGATNNSNIYWDCSTYGFSNVNIEVGYAGGVNVQLEINGNSVATGGTSIFDTYTGTVAGPFTSLRVRAFNNQKPELFYVKINGQILVDNAPEVILTLSDSTNLANMSVGDNVVEVGGGGDATGVISSINSAGPTVTLSSITGTWDVGSVVKDTTAPTVIPPAPTTDPPDSTKYTSVVSVTNDTTNKLSYRVPTSSLAVSSTYYARVKYNSISNPPVYSSSWSAWSSFATTSSFAITPGTAMQGGYYAGQILVQPGEDGGGLPTVATLYNLIVAPFSSAGKYGGNKSPGPGGADWKLISNGDANPPANNAVYGAPMTAAGSHPNYPIFNAILNDVSGPNAGTYDPTNSAGTGIGGYNDWYLPAKNELEVCYFNLKPTAMNNNTSSGSNPNAVSPEPVSTNYTLTSPAQTADSAFQGSATESFDTGKYWSATQDSGNVGQAWAQSFGDGSQTSEGKDVSLYFSWRAIRRVLA